MFMDNRAADERAEENVVCRRRHVSLRPSAGGQGCRSAAHGVCSFARQFKAYAPVPNQEHGAVNPYPQSKL